MLSNLVVSPTMLEIEAARNFDRESMFFKVTLLLTAVMVSAQGVLNLVMYLCRIIKVIEAQTKMEAFSPGSETLFSELGIIGGERTGSKSNRMSSSFPASRNEAAELGEDHENRNVVPEKPASLHFQFFARIFEVKRWGKYWRDNLQDSFFNLETVSW